MTEQTKKTKKGKGKEKSFMDRMVDLFILCVIVGAVFFVGALIKENQDAKKQETKEVSRDAQKDTKENKEDDKDKATEKPESTPLPEGVVRYDSCITASVLENDTVFYMLFDYNNNTYQELVQVASLEDTLDEGTFKETKKGLKTTSTINEDLSETYIMDGEYIIPESAIFKGDIGTEDSFDSDCVQESKDYTTTISFSKGGTYAELKEAKIKEVSDTSKGGSYKRTEKFIQRTSAEGEVLLDLYIYKNQIANAYYKEVTG